MTNTINAPKTAPETTPETFVDALNSAFGKQTTNRATHPKGIVLLGNFTPNQAAKNLSKQRIFRLPFRLPRAFPITPEFRRCPMPRRSPARTEWRSNFICPTARKPIL